MSALGGFLVVRALPASQPECAAAALTTATREAQLTLSAHGPGSIGLFSGPHPRPRSRHLALRAGDGRRGGGAPDRIPGL